MYKLYTDKTEIFTADVSVKNASLNNSIARLIIESNDGLSLVFKGKVEGEKCVIPIKKLKGLLNESSKGNMHLEIIVEDVYFKPWESEYVVEEHTSVKVQVKEQVDTSSKPILEVKVKNPQKPSIVSSPISSTVDEILYACKRLNITSKNYRGGKKQMFRDLIKEYFSQNKKLKKSVNSILKEVITRF